VTAAYGSTATGEMMSAFFSLEPEVAGGLGPHTVMDRRVHPPVVSKLHYEFDGWPSDEIVESFPCFLVTESLMARLQAEELTGMETAEVEVSISEQFRDSHSGTKLPPFAWLKVVGVAGRDDFGMGPDFRLVVSAAALRVIQATRPKAMDVAAFAG
jgi:hypothetical protein